MTKSKKLLTEKEVLEIQKDCKEIGESDVEDITNLCFTVLELQRLLKAEKLKRKEDARRVVKYIEHEMFPNGQGWSPQCAICKAWFGQHETDCKGNIETGHFKAIVEGE